MPAVFAQFHSPHSARLLSARARSRRRFLTGALATSAVALLAACAQAGPATTGAPTSAPSASGGTATAATPAVGTAGSSASAAGTLTLSQYSAPSGFNVLTAAEQYAYDAIGLIFASLTRQDDKLAVQPELAQTWDISPDGLTYTYHHNPNAQ